MLGAVASLLPAASCALVAHALLYGSLMPHDAAHGYFGWYEPLVAALTLVAVCGSLVLLAVALGARLLGRPIRRVTAPVPFAERFRTFAGFGLLVVIVQESIERSAQAGRPGLAGFTPMGWALLAIGVAVSAAVLAAAVRLAEAAASFIFATLRCRRAVRRPVGLAWCVVTGVRRHPRPLAACRALRAPPLPAS
jgi:hypothetical protein